MKSKDGITRICLWSGPRNISTTLMYSFAQRADTTVFDEPLYAHYLCNTNANEYHPGADDVIASQENDGQKVIDMMIGVHAKPVVFFKNMTHHLLALDRTFMKDVVNVILTRDPKEMIPSFAKVIDNPTIADIGYKLHTELIEYFEKEGINYIVLDSKKILLNPKKVLSEFCNRIGIEFYSSMLNWQAGARKEDGSWARFWYENVHKSTGYIPYKPKTSPFPKNLIPLLKDCQPHYDKIVEKAIH
jgi:hypothetical protein